MASASVNAEGGDEEDTVIALHEALQQALKQFRKEISPGHLERFQTGSVMQLQHECYFIQKDQERFNALSNLRRIEPFMCRLQEFQVILKVFSNDESYVSYIWGAMQFLIRTASSTLKDGLDGLLSAYEAIGKSIPKLKGLENLFLEAPGLRRCLGALYSDMLKFHSGAYQCFTQFSEKSAKKIFKSSWKEFEKHDLCHLEVMVKKHKDIVGYGKQCLTSRPLQASGTFLAPEDWRDLRRMAHEYGNNCDKEEQEHKRNEEKRREKQFKAARQWILPQQDFSSANNPSTANNPSSSNDSSSAKDPSKVKDSSDKIHLRLCEERLKYPGTCDWIAGEPLIDNWLSESTQTHPILWVNGHMGSGKSTIASYLIDKCLEKTPAESSFRTTFFYCNGLDLDTTTFLSISSGLLHRQLMHIRENEKFRHLIAYCHDKKINSNQASLKDEGIAESLLRTFFEIIPDQYIVVDGLDECDKPVIRDILKILTSVVAQQEAIDPGRLRLLVVSRDLAEIKHSLFPEQANPDIFKIEQDNNADAIEMYVHQRMDNFDPKFELSDEKRQEIIEKTFDAAKGAQGMFLFARLTLDHLEKSVSIENLDYRLEKDHFPKTIGKAFMECLQGNSYNCLLESIKNSLDDEELWKKARCIFGWLTCAGRPLHWHEIQAIASIERHEHDGKVVLIQRSFIPAVQEFCGTLVHVSPGNKVELIHHTAQEHILKSELVSEQKVQFELTILCMDYLTFPCFEKGILESTRKKFALEGFYAFQDYAISKWFYHIAALLKIKDLDVDGPKAQELVKVLDKFTIRYEESVDDMDSPPSSAASEPSQIDMEEVKKQAIQECEVLKGEPFYKLVLNLWVHITKHEKESPENRNKPCLKEMEKVLEGNRKVIEALGELKGNEKPDRLHDFYGQYLYKCPKTRCDYFHEGLEDDEKRKRHIARHDRPFMCVIPGCTMAEAGFLSNKDLERHKKSYHPEYADGLSPFIQRTRQSSEAKFECRHCPKKFTRKINLEGHTRSHFGDRPYSCQTCSKKFTRLNDLRRHEKLHLRR